MDRNTSVVLLDLDGTLMDTKSLYLECYRRAVEPRLRRAPDDEELLSLKPRSELRFLESLVGPDAMEACLADFYGHYHALHAEHFGGIYDGVTDMLRDLRAGGHPLGLVTGKSRRSWEITAAVAPLPPFDVMVLDDDVTEPKPHPQGIRAALDALSARAEHAVYIGDTMGDVLAAAAAGVQPIAALWGRGATASAFAERASAEGAWLAERPAEIRGLVARRVDASPASSSTT